MSDLLGCAVFLWALAILIGIALIEHRLSRITRFIDREERRRNGGSR